MLLKKRRFPLLLVLIMFISGITAACNALGAEEAGEETAVFTPGSSSAATYVVSTSGDDDNEGSEAAPWRTIQHAADVVQPGDTVLIRGGRYHEAVDINVSGSADGGYITFMSYAGETAVLDGDALTNPDGDIGIEIAGQSYLIIKGLEIRNYATTIPDAVPMGIVVNGASHHIELRGNNIHHIETHAPLDGDLLGADAHGIAVYGDAADPAHDIIITGNDLHDLILGSSEALTVNGNVETFTISDNRVHDSDNIGIVMIGFEDTAPDPAVDRARNGVVSGNVVYNIDSFNNPSYGGERSADGLYVDGGVDIVIEGNTVYDSNIGIEVTSEHEGGNASRVTVRNNLFYHNHVLGIGVGGYDEMRGSTFDCTFVNNTLFQNDTLQDGNGELFIQDDVHDNLFQNNIFAANEQSLLVGNPFATTQNNTFDNNLYFAPAGAADSEWQWNDVTYTGFAAYQAATGNDAHGLFADPLFVDAGTPDFHLQAASPAVDAGVNLPEAGEVDFDGRTRVQNGVIDLGAYEFGQETAVYLPLVSTPAAQRADGAVQLDIPLDGSLQNGAWSPDGRQLLFTHFRSGYNVEPADLYVFSLDDSTLRTLVADGSGNINLPGSAWNGATGRIAFSSSREPHDEIFVIAENGQTGDETAVTHRPDHAAYEPAFSPDGRWIVFESHPVDVEDHGVITRYQVDGGGAYEALTAAADDARQPNWSPAGDLILYQRFANGQWDIWLMDADGGGKRQLTGGDGDKTDAVFSADGRFIVYSSDQGELPFANLFTIPVSGGEPEQLTHYNGYDGAPSWSPDGQWIVFESSSGDPDEGGTALWLIRWTNSRASS